MSLFPGLVEDSENDTVMGKCGAESLGSTVKNVMHGSWTDDKEGDNNVVHNMIEIANLGNIWRLL
jgi:hypothetical protein